MAARPETKNVLQGKSDLSLMPLAEGIAHFLGELSAGCPEAEVLITERRHWQRFAAGLGQLVAGTPGPTAATSVLAVETPASAPVETVDLRTHRCQLRQLPHRYPMATEISNLTRRCGSWAITVLPSHWPPGCKRRALRCIESVPPVMSTPRWPNSIYSGPKHRPNIYFS